MGREVKRVLVTGSREWTNKSRLFAELNDQLASTEPGEWFILVHGQCPTGADALAAQWGQGAPRFIDVEPHPADWERACDENCYHKPRTKNGRSYCPMAGHLRNQLMVDLGADICLAFPLPGPRKLSRGTWDCHDRAERAGIPVKVIQGG